MPFGLSQPVWAGLPAQQQANEANGYRSWLENGVTAYRLTGPTDHSGYRDEIATWVPGYSGPAVTTRYQNPTPPPASWNVPPAPPRAPTPAPAPIPVRVIDPPSPPATDVDWTDWRSWGNPNEPDDPFPKWLIVGGLLLAVVLLSRPGR